MKAFVPLGKQAQFEDARLGSAPVAPYHLLRRDRIANTAGHSGFGDLIRFQGRYLACYREGTDHNVTLDGAIRIIASSDFVTWTSLALITATAGTDLRDCHLTETPWGQVMLNTLTYDGVTAQSVTYLSSDGVTWSGPNSIGDAGVWIWRAAWLGSNGYGVGYSDPANGFLRLYRTSDGVTWTAVSDPLTGNYPNETALLFVGETLYLLVRRDTGGFGFATNALLLSAPPPYTSWTTQDLGARFSSPCMARLADGRILAGGRMLSATRVTLAWLTLGGTLTEVLELARGSDCGYPGLLVEGLLARTVYYSNHDTKACVYAAQVGLPAA